MVIELTQEPGNGSQIDEIKETLLAAADIRSTDPLVKVACGVFKQVGEKMSMQCVIGTNKIDMDLPTRDTIQRTKLFYNRVEHAEINMLRELGWPRNLHEWGDLVYLTHFPCVACIKVLKQIGVKQVYYIDDGLSHAYGEKAHEYASTLPIEFIKI